MRLLLPILLLCSSIGRASAPAFLERHCYDCHDAETKKGDLDLTALTFDAAHLERWIKVHDAVEHGDMPPKKKKQLAKSETVAFLSELDAKLLALAKSGQPSRIRMRRMTRVEFQNTLQDLLSLPRLDITALLPADGRVAGYDKMAGALDISPAHLAAYEEAVEKALDAAIATSSTPPRVFKRRIYPAGLFKFGGNLLQGQFVLLKAKQPDPALPARGGFEGKKGFVGDDGPDLEERRKVVHSKAITESRSAVGLLNPNLAGYEAAMNVSPIYAGVYRMRLSLWGFHWNAGKPEPCAAPQAAVLRAHEEGKQQEGGRLLRAFTAPSMQSNEAEITEWLDAHESIVFDPVSVPWTGLRVGQVAGRALKHVGPGVAIDWFEIEGPIHDVWPPLSHQRLFGNLPIKAWPKESDAIPPRREEVRSISGYVPSMHFDLTPQERKPALQSVQSVQPEADARKLLTEFLPKAF